MQDSNSHSKRYLRVTLAILSCVWFLVLTVFVAYRIGGTHLVQEIYEQRSVSLLNEMMGGRDAYPLEHYLAKADAMVRNGLLMLLFLTILSILAVFWVARSGLATTEFAEQLKCVSVLTIPMVAAFFVLMVIAWHAYVANLPVGDFTRDPASVADGSPFIGFVSNMGMLLWCSAAAVCLFCYIKRVRDRVFLLASGLLTSMLLLDDLFMFHEHVFPRYLGIPEPVTFLIYGMATSAYLFYFARCIVRTEFVILFVGLALFGSSIYVDELVKHSDWTYLLEDGFKFFGIVAWATYLLRVCSQFTDEWNVRIQ